MKGAWVELCAWEISRFTLPCGARLAQGMTLLNTLRSAGSTVRFLSGALLEVAEAHHEAGDPGARALALEAASALRRGQATPRLYLPDALVRCARVLQASDPTEAAALVHVARHWVLQALPHVPALARQSFMTEIPANRLLLGDQPPAQSGSKSVSRGDSPNAS
jgi:hypothetical protein